MSVGVASFVVLVPHHLHCLPSGMEDAAFTTILHCDRTRLLALALVLLPVGTARPEGVREGRALQVAGHAVLGSPQARGERRPARAAASRRTPEAPIHAAWH